MNSGGGGVYNKSTARRKTSSLVLSRPHPNSGAGGVVTTAGARRSDHDSGGGRRGGQLQLQSVSKAPLALTAIASSSKPVEHRNGQHRQHWNTGPPPPAANNTRNVSTNNGDNGYSSGGYVGPSRGDMKPRERIPNWPTPGNGQNKFELGERGKSGGRGSQTLAQPRQQALSSRAQSQFAREVVAPARPSGQAPQSSTATSLHTSNERRCNDATQPNSQALSQQFRRGQQHPVRYSSNAQLYPPSRGALSSANVYGTATTPIISAEAEERRCNGTPQQSRQALPQQTLRNQQQSARNNRHAQNSPPSKKTPSSPIIHAIATTSNTTARAEDMRYDGSSQQNQQALPQPARNSRHSQHNPPSNGAPSATATTSNNTAGSFDDGRASLSNDAWRAEVKAVPPPSVPAHNHQHIRQPGNPQSSATQATGAGGRGSVALPEGEAVLRARLAELEKRNTQMLARVQDLEEHNFDLEASMQLIEAEASHRVKKEARALQSELSFKDHQLKQAQSNHTTAVRELNAERSRRKADREQARRERNSAVEAAAAASATVAEAKAAAATVEIATNTEAAQAEGRVSRDTAANRDEERVLLLPTLVELVLEDMSEDFMVLLHAGAAGCGGGAGESGAVGDAGTLWAQTPSGFQRCRGEENRGVFSPSSPSIALDSMSPRRARIGDINSSSGRVGGNVGVNGSSDREGSAARRIGRGREFSGASPLSLAFSPVMLAPRQRGPGADELSAVRGAWKSVSPRACDGRLSCRKSWKGDRADAQSSPQYRSNEIGGVREVDGGRLDKDLRLLSSRMFACAIALVQGEACAGDLMDVLLGFLETAGEACGGDLEILVSATRLVHRTLAVVSPAASAVALGDACHATPPERQGLPSTNNSVAAAAVAGSVEPDGDCVGGAKQALPSSPPPGKGKKRVRSDIGGEGGSGGNSERRPADVVVVVENEDGGVADDDADEASRSDGRRAVRRPRYDESEGNRLCPPGAKPLRCHLFVAGEPVRARNVSLTPSSISGAGTVTEASPSDRLAGVGKGGKEIYTVRGTGREQRDRSWAGRHGERELGRRLKGQLVASFHLGAARGCSALVGGCLETILCALWDRTGEELTPWGCLLESESFREVMLSEVHRSVWEIGARVLRVLTRNASLFRRMLTVGGPLESVVAVGGAGRAGDEECAPAKQSRITGGSIAPPTPPFGDGRGFRHGGGSVSGGGKDNDVRDAGAGDSLLRRLCLEAVAVGDHTSFGRDVGLRLSVIRLVFSVCHRYGVEATWPLFGSDGRRGGNAEDDAIGSGPSTAVLRSTATEQPRALGLIPSLVTFVRVELEDWEIRRYSQPNPIHSERNRLLKEAFQLLWALATHTPLPLRDMAQGAGMFNTMVSVVSRFYNSVEMEEFQVHKEALMLMEKMN